MALNHSMTVDVLNNEETERFVVLLVFLGIIMLTGIPGNILVIVIYRRNAAKTNYQFFITCLGVVDCISCCVVPFAMLEASHQYHFHGNWLCKFTLFLQCWPTLISAGTLIVIGIDRYRMVCKPHDWQIPNRLAKHIFAVLCFSTAVGSSPFLILFGVNEIQLHPYNLTGTTCSTLKEYHETVWINLFNGLLWILFMNGLTIIAVIYIFIARQIFRRTMKSPTTSTFSKHEVSIGGSESNEPSASFTRHDTSTISDASTKIKVSDKQTSDSGFAVTETEIDTVNQNVDRDKNCATRVIPKVSLRQSKESKARQTVFVMFLISLFFIIAFLPHLILRLIGAVNAKLFYTLSDEWRAVYGFFLRCFYINPAVNPLVYCACASKLRKDAKALILGAVRYCTRR